MTVRCAVVPVAETACGWNGDSRKRKGLFLTGGEDKRKKVSLSGKYG
jgi:hypothetical protein